MHLTVASVVCPCCACTVHSAHIDAVSIPVREIEHQHTWQFYAHAGATAIQVSEQKPISSLFGFFFFTKDLYVHAPESLLHHYSRVFAKIDSCMHMRHMRHGVAESGHFFLCANGTGSNARNQIVPDEIKSWMR